MAAAGQGSVKIKLITNVSEFGLFAPLAQSRLSLVIAVLVSNAVLVGYTFFIASYVNDTSASVSLNLVLITMAMLLLLMTSYLDAMLIGDLFFPGNFRERVLSGTKKDVDPDSPEALRQSSYKSYNLAFLIVVAVLILTNYFGLQALCGDYLDQYHRVGFHLTRLRSDDSAEKIAALKELAKPIYADLWNLSRVEGAIAGELDSADPQVRAWAAWTVGEAKMTDTLDPLVERLRDEDETVRAEAAVALGKMGDGRATESLRFFLAASRDAGDKDLILAGLRAMALLKDPDVGPAVMKFLDHEDPEVSAHAYWAVGVMRYWPARPTLLARWKEGSAADKCSALEGLKYLARPEDVRPFKDAFILGNEDACDWLIWEDRDGDKHYIRFKESHRVKYVKIVFNADGVNQRDWFRTLAADRDLPYEIREAASDRAKELQAAGH